MSDDDSKRIQDAMSDAFNRTFERAILGLDYSTATDRPEPPALDVNKLLAIMQDMRRNDPLLKRGIELDWVCVIHPRIVDAIRQIADSEDRTLYHPAEDPIRRATGRRTWVLNEAKSDIEYMTEEVFKQRYPEAYAKYERQMLGTDNKED